MLRGEPQHRPAHEPLTSDELRRDAVDSYYLAVAEIGRQVREGRPLPAFFRSMREAAE